MTLGRRLHPSLPAHRLARLLNTRPSKINLTAEGGKEATTMKWMKAYGVPMLMLALLVVAGSPVSVEAQGRQMFNQRQAYQTGERNGYEYGLREGREDRRRGRRYNDRLNLNLRDNRWGYASHYRHEDDYRRGFRQGYVAGYRAGFETNRR